MKVLYSSVFFLLSVTISFAQQAPGNTGKPVSTVDMSLQFKAEYERNKLKADSIASITNQELRYVNTTGEAFEFSGFDANGQMLFYRTNNIGSGRTISTNKVWPGGTTGTSLTGAGLTGRLGEWDGGAVLATHQELTGRVTQGDFVSATLTHSTHVAGTLIASGVDPNAKGMAYQGNLKAYDWNNDKSEMTTAASNGMLISNHSYGTTCGWALQGSNWYWFGDLSLSSTIDYKYGFYSQETANWDQIAHNNPYYLICKAAGNDRGMNKPSNVSTYYVRDANFNWVLGSTTNVPPAVSQYDCMEPVATAKNILTVGAVNKINNSNSNSGWSQPSDVVMSSFSAWGPTDDGRIKPDVVAAGVNVYSTSDLSPLNTAYTTLSGTSMATPAAAGSLILVQQHYNNLNGHFMKSATLKGLAIHTADEAGNPGPDYTFGWGLLNIASAVTHITDSFSNKIEEQLLLNNETHTEHIKTDGTKPLRVTLCWNDIAGTPVNPSLNPSNSMLVHDLDLRLKRDSDGRVFQPYILNPANPTLAATTGDNILDNVEQVFIAAPAAGSYTLLVSHKSSLVGPQEFSLLISGVAELPKAAFTSTTRFACSGQTVTFTDQSLWNPTSRTWYFPGGTPSQASSSSVDVVYATSGTYSVMLSVTNSLGQDSVYASDYISVGGLGIPFQETFESRSHTLSSWSIENPDNDTTWSYRTIGGTSPGNRAASMNFYNYGAIGQRDAFISPTLNLKGFSDLDLSFEHAYAVYPAQPTDSLIVSISSDCGNSWTPLSRMGENGSNSFATTSGQFAEFVPAAATEWCGHAFATCNTIDLTPWAGMDNIRIKFESYNNNSNNLYIDNVNIDGTPLAPVVNFTTARTTVCAGETVTFKDSTQNPVSTWQWTFPGATPSSSSQQNPNDIIYSTPGTYDVTLVVSNATGQDSITKTGYITVLPAMTVPAISASGPLTLCSGETVTLTSDSASAYQWYKDGIPLANETNRTYTGTNEGVYMVETTNGAGCKAQSASIRIGLFLTGPDTSYHDSIGTYSVVNNNGSTYFWTITNGKQQSGGNSNEITVKWDGVSAYGTVAVQENTASNCVNNVVTKYVTLLTYVGIAPVDAFPHLNVYPNPAHELLTIECDLTKNQPVEVVIYNTMGQVVYKDHTTPSTGYYKQQINTSQLANGMYVVMLKNNTGVKQVKVMVE